MDELEKENARFKQMIADSQRILCVISCKMLAATVCNVIDNFNREVSGLEIDLSLTVEHVVRMSGAAATGSTCSCC